MEESMKNWDFYGGIYEELGFLWRNQYRIGILYGNIYLKKKMDFCGNIYFKKMRISMEESIKNWDFYGVIYTQLGFCMGTSI